MDTKFTILWDMDAVTTDWERAFQSAFEKKFSGKPFLSAQTREHWWVSKNFPEAMRGEIDSIAYSPGFFLSLPIKEGALEAMQWCLSQGFGICICTAPLHAADATLVARCIQEKVLWIKKHVGSFATLFTPTADVQVVFAHDKTLIHGDVLIDDNPSIEGVKKPSWKQLLFDEEYLFSKQIPLQKINWGNYREVISREYDRWLKKQNPL